jgi:hypothetical protein
MRFRLTGILELLDLDPGLAIKNREGNNNQFGDKAKALNIAQRASLSFKSNGSLAD